MWSESVRRQWSARYEGAQVKGKSEERASLDLFSDEIAISVMRRLNQSRGVGVQGVPRPWWV